MNIHEKGAIFMSYQNYANSKYVFLIGNGINRIGGSHDISWQQILENFEVNSKLSYVDGYPLPEFFELLSLYNRDGVDTLHRTQFVEAIDALVGNNYHKEVYQFCNRHHIDILTTNFDHAFQKTNNLVKTSTRKLDKKFTDFYPWQVFYTEQGHKNSDQGIRLFHINGDQYYKRSLKLTVKDYAGNITYFNRRYNPLQKNSKYANDETWINCLFDKDVIIFGLALGDEEIFIRNVLIQRALYRKKMKMNGTSGYYLYCTQDFKDDTTLAQYTLFFKAVGIEMVPYETYHAIYERK